MNILYIFLLFGQSVHKIFLVKTVHWRWQIKHVQHTYINIKKY